MLRLTPVQRGWDDTAPSVVRLVKGSRMEGMIVHVVGQVLVCQRRDLRWNLTERESTDLAKSSRRWWSVGPASSRMDPPGRAGRGRQDLDGTDRGVFR